MIKLLEQAKDRSSIQLYYDSCSVDLDDIHSLVMLFDEPDKASITIDATTNPTVLNFLSDEFLIPFRETSLSFIGKNKFKDGVYKFKTYLLYDNLGNIAANKGQNEISLTNILNDFQFSDVIWLGDRPYDIDKELSTQNKLVLTEPLEADANTYKVVKTVIPNQFIVLTRGIEEQMLVKINKLTGCARCKEQARQLSMNVMFLLGLINNVDCQDLEGAETIYNNLVAEYNDDKCC